MNWLYFVKLLVFSAAFFFILHGVLGLVTYFAAPAAIRLAESMPSRRGARVLFSLRLFPSTFSVLAVLGLCAPSYLLFEPRECVERLSLLCFTAALLGLAIWGISIAQTVRGLTRSVRLIREFEIASHEIYLPGEPSPALVISHGPPIFAMCGIVHPRLVFSRDVQLALTAKEFDVTIRHERAHRNSGDNLKRLLLLLAPEISPFSRCFRDLEDAWVKMSEWAADDEATLGDPLAAIALAEAIIRVARLGVRAPSPICASLVADTSFSVRVVRLLQTERVAVSELSPQRPVRKTSIAVFGAALLIAAATLAINLWSPILYTLHRFLEQIAR